MDKIFVKNLLARGIIGINPDERDHPQDILINIILFVDTRKAAISDHIEDTVSYSLIAKKALAIAETSQCFTVESLAEQISRTCLEIVGVQKVQVRVEKPGAVRFAQSVGVEIEREN